MSIGAGSLAAASRIAARQLNPDPLRNSPRRERKHALDRTPASGTTSATCSAFYVKVPNAGRSGIVLQELSVYRMSRLFPAMRGAFASGPVGPRSTLWTLLTAFADRSEQLPTVAGAWPRIVMTRHKARSIQHHDREPTIFCLRLYVPSMRKLTASLPSRPARVMQRQSVCGGVAAVSRSA